MEICLCNTIHQLASNFDELRAKKLISALNFHLGEIRSVLAQSKTLAKGAQYHIVPSNHRTAKILQLKTVDLAPATHACESFKNNTDGFWDPSEDVSCLELRRRLACVAIFLRLKLDAEGPIPTSLSRLFPGQKNYWDVRNAGRKYIKIARRLGGIGALFWLPQAIPSSTYERYLNMHDEEIFTHLESLNPQFQAYTPLVQRFIFSQVCLPPLSKSYYNLSFEYIDLFPRKDQLILLLYAFGGCEVPDVILKDVRSPQRRWSVEGEILYEDPVKFGLSPELVQFLSEDTRIQEIVACPEILQNHIDDQVVGLSIHPEQQRLFSQVLLPHTVRELQTTALKIICFTCPPCYEGNTTWTPVVKQFIWPILKELSKKDLIPTFLATQVLDAVLYFGERDSVAMRQEAASRAEQLLRKSMPYYLHASVALFHSVLHRLDGDLIGSEKGIRNFLTRGPQPVTRKDHALRGRLHISRLETKIKCYDNDVPIRLYDWEAERPFSTLDFEVTSRLQNVAARFFQSVGKFSHARDCLKQFLTLNTVKPIRINTRRLVVGRLADIYCEMGESAKALDILQPELDAVNKLDRRRRTYRRLVLAAVEAHIGLYQLETAKDELKVLKEVMPLEPGDLYDQQLHMRMMIADARIEHMSSEFDQAVKRWQLALEEVGHMQILTSSSQFITGLIYLSKAYAQLQLNDRDGGWKSWSTGKEILQSTMCEFWVPIIATSWLQQIVKEVHAREGWSVSLILPHNDTVLLSTEDVNSVCSTTPG